MNTSKETLKKKQQILPKITFRLQLQLQFSQKKKPHSRYCQ